jgi:cold shock CspA family protein
MYGFIQQEVGRDIKFNLSKLDRIGLDVLEWNEVEFVIWADEKVRIARVIKDNK